MPKSPTDLSPDVQRLVDAKFSIAIVEGQYLILDNVPYVPTKGQIARAALISPYSEVNGVAQVGNDHTVWFTGTIPCMADGTSLESAMVCEKTPQIVAGRQTYCRFSNKPDPIGGMLDNFYNKMTHYVQKLQAYAQAVDETAFASTATGSFQRMHAKSVFHYTNTAIARAGLDVYDDKLKLKKVAIVGVGGTGSYILDAIAKTPIEEIHLYDDDVLDAGNAFRLPGALSKEQTERAIPKTQHAQEVYSALRTGVISHPKRVDETNIQELDDCSFVFLAIDNGPSRGFIARYLCERRIRFVDVGLGVDKVPELAQLIAKARTTFVNRGGEHIVGTLPTADDKDDAIYNNIQLVELNALNAMLAVIRYKQAIGFYSDEMNVDTSMYILPWTLIRHR
jgi:hypothetical protein